MPDLGTTTSTPAMMEEEEECDVVIIGAGPSGINAAYKIKTEMPEASFAILEARDVIGGTWSFFRYPGIRSDSYLTGFGFRWRPWREDKEIADGPMIQRYLEESVRHAGLDEHIRLGHKVAGAHWSTPEARWTLDVDVDVAGGGGGRSRKTLRAGFVLACSGYYDYETPLRAEIPGLASFRGRVAHPQFWPEDLDCAGKRVVIVGSGATAVTMLPALARTAARVTMLQRSPGYVLPLASAPAHVYRARRWLPARLADAVNFWRDVLSQALLRAFCRALPGLARRVLIGAMGRQLRGTGVPVDPHFTPSYAPWAQRLCVCPDGDFYDALRRGDADVVTDRVEAVTARGLRTASGLRLDADVIVTATGLRVLLLGGARLTVDGGPPVRPADRFAWRSLMLEGVPNLAMVVGYTDMSWTLGSDACLRLLLRVLRRMRALGAAAVRPVVPAGRRDAMRARAGPLIGMRSTYFLAAADELPRRSDADPWGERKGYISESLLALFGTEATITKDLEFIMPGADQAAEVSGCEDGEASGQANGQANGHASGKANGQKQD